MQLLKDIFAVLYLVHIAGILKLLLQKEAYERLGLVGKLSSFTKHTYGVCLQGCV